MTRRKNDAAVAYVRVSTDEQHLGPEAQRTVIEAWAARVGVTVVAWHEDHGVSGAAPVDERPGLRDALASLRRHRAALLVAHKRDRLARDVEVAAEVERRARRAGATIATADGVSSDDTTDGLLQRRISDVFAEAERGRTRDRTRAALAVKRTRGERISRHPPFGWRIEGEQQLADGRRAGGRLVADPEEQKAITRIERMLIARETLGAMVRSLTAFGHRPRGAKWHKTTVARIVRRLQERA